MFFSLNNVYTVILDPPLLDKTRDVAKMFKSSNFDHEIMRKGYYRTLGWQDNRILEAVIRINSEMPLHTKLIFKTF